MKNTLLLISIILNVILIAGIIWYAFNRGGMLKSEIAGNKKVFRANTGHPLFSDIHNILLKTIGFDQIIDRVVTKLENVEYTYVTGRFARGMDSPIIDLVLVGDEINQEYLLKLIDKTQDLINRKIRYVIFTPEEFDSYRDNLNSSESLLLWRKDENT